MPNIENLFTLEAEETRYLEEDSTSSLHWFHVTKRKHIYIAFVWGLAFFLMLLYLSLRIAKECGNNHCHTWHANWHIKQHIFAFFPAWKICQKWIPFFFGSASHQSEEWISWWWYWRRKRRKRRRGEGRSKKKLTYSLTLDSHKQYHINSKQAT